MTLIDNVLLGAYLRDRAPAFWRARCGSTAPRRRARAPRRWRSSSASASATKPHELAGNLPLGRQRILEVARALAADPALIMLDEPAAGLSRPEKRALADCCARCARKG